jgi:hypothetical protein
VLWVNERYGGLSPVDEQRGFERYRQVRHTSFEKINVQEVGANSLRLRFSHGRTLGRSQFYSRIVGQLLARYRRSPILYLPSLRVNQGLTISAKNEFLSSAREATFRMILRFFS